MTATEQAIGLARAAAAAAGDKQAANIVAFDVSEQLALTDVFVICSADSDPQARAIYDAVEQRMGEENTKALRREGEREGRWILLDFGDIVVHILRKEDREFYALERLWNDCPAVDLRV